MRRMYFLLALLGLLEMAFAVPKDPNLTDESLIREHFQRSQAQARELLRKRDAKRQEFMDRAQIGRAGDSCLAYAIESGDCSISAAQFDRYLPSYLPDSLEAQSDEAIALSASKARRAIFDQLLDRAFLNAYQPDSLSPPDPRPQKSRNGNGTIINAVRFPVLLLALPEIRIQVLAASDSAWLATRIDNFQSRILPVTMPASRLTGAVLMSLANSAYGEWTPIQRVSFGYLTCSWLDRLPSPEALGKLLSILDRIESQAKRGSRSEAILALQNHKESCLEEDTLDLSLQLAPPRRRNDGDQETARMRIPSTDLPASIKTMVWTKLGRGKKDSLGPVRSDYGIWNISKRSPKLRAGHMADSVNCLARIEAKIRIDLEAKLMRSEWERISSKMKDPEKNEVRTALLEQLSKQGPYPESAYNKMREQWASRSLRFTQDVEPLIATSDSSTGSAQTPE